MTDQNPCPPLEELVCLFTDRHAALDIEQRRGHALHVMTCATCQTTMREFDEVSEASDRVVAVRRRPASGSFAPQRIPVALAASSSSVLEQSDDTGDVAWSVVRGASGAIEIHVDGRRPEHVGVTLRVSAGPWRAEEPLTEDVDGFVSVKFEIPAIVYEQLSPGDVITIEEVPSDEGDDDADRGPSGPR